MTFIRRKTEVIDSDACVAVTVCSSATTPSIVLEVERWEIDSSGRRDRFEMLLTLGEADALCRALRSACREAAENGENE